MNNNPIGLFDSGVGGLTVAKELMKQLPGESILYFGDTARLPYGSKSPEEILRFVREIMGYLVSQRAKMVVMACNTSSALALEAVRKEFPLPVLGLIHPGMESALAASRNGRIGIMATQATVNSHAYQKEGLNLNPSVHISEVACPRLVPLVEGGNIQSPETVEALTEYLTPLRQAGVDTLVMGCTHYPFLRTQIHSVMGEGVTLVDPAQALVKEVVALLHERNFAADPSRPAPRRYAVSGPVEEFVRAARQFMEIGPEDVMQVDVELRIKS